MLKPIHPGEIIREEILTPLGMSVNQLAKHLGVDAARLNEIVRGRRGVTADTAPRLARYLGTTPEFWLKLQVHYDIRVASQAKLKDIERAVRPKSSRRTWKMTHSSTSGQPE
jgi:addiction module HigA family antidote